MLKLNYAYYGKMSLNKHPSQRGHMLSRLIGEETVNLECRPPPRLIPPLSSPPPELKTASKLDWTWERWAMSRALCLMRTFIFILHRSAHMCLPCFRQHCDSETFKVHRMAPEKTDVLQIRNCTVFVVKHDVCPWIEYVLLIQRALLVFLGDGLVKSHRLDTF